MHNSSNSWGSGNFSVPNNTNYNQGFNQNFNSGSNYQQQTYYNSNSVSYNKQDSFKNQRNDVNYNSYGNSYGNQSSFIKQGNISSQSNYGSSNVGMVGGGHDYNQQQQPMLQQLHQQQHQQQQPMLQQLQQQQASAVRSNSVNNCHQQPAGSSSSYVEDTWEDKDMLSSPSRKFVKLAPKISREYRSKETSLPRGTREPPRSSSDNPHKDDVANSSGKLENLLGQLIEVLGNSNLPNDQYKQSSDSTASRKRVNSDRYRSSRRSDSFRHGDDDEDDYYHERRSYASRARIERPSTSGHRHYQSLLSSRDFPVDHNVRKEIASLLSPHLDMRNYLSVNRDMDHSRRITMKKHEDEKDIAVKNALHMNDADEGAEMEVPVVNGTRVFIFGLEFATLDEQLVKMFRRFGPIKRAVVHHGSGGGTIGTGDVLFVQRKDAVQAVRYYMNKKCGLLLQIVGEYLPPLISSRLGKRPMLPNLQQLGKRKKMTAVTNNKKLNQASKGQQNSKNKKVVQQLPAPAETSQQVKSKKKGGKGAAQPVINKKKTMQKPTQQSNNSKVVKKSPVQQSDNCQNVGNEAVQASHCSEKIDQEPVQQGANGKQLEGPQQGNAKGGKNVAKKKKSPNNLNENKVAVEQRLSRNTGPEISELTKQSRLMKRRRKRLRAAERKRQLKMLDQALSEQKTEADKVKAAQTSKSPDHAEDDNFSFESIKEDDNLWVVDEDWDCGVLPENNEDKEQDTPPEAALKANKDCSDQADVAVKCDENGKSGGGEALSKAEDGAFATTTFIVKDFA